MLKSIVKVFFRRCGLTRIHGTALQQIVRSFLNQIDFEYFRKQNPCAHFTNRKALFAFVADQVGTNQVITFLEFGVFKGESIRLWAVLNSNPLSRFWGFDSFEGLPERWDKDRGKGLFDVGGKVCIEITGHAL